MSIYDPDPCIGDVDALLAKIDESTCEIKRRVEDRDFSYPAFRKLYRFLVRAKKNYRKVLKEMDSIDEEEKRQENRVGFTPENEKSRKET